MSSEHLAPFTGFIFLPFLAFLAFLAFTLIYIFLSILSIDPIYKTLCSRNFYSFFFCVLLANGGLMANNKLMANWRLSNVK